MRQMPLPLNAPWTTARYLPDFDDYDPDRDPLQGFSSGPTDPVTNTNHDAVPPLNRPPQAYYSPAFPVVCLRLTVKRNAVPTTSV